MPWSKHTDYSTGYRQSHMDVPVKDSTPYRLSVRQVSGSGPRGGHTWSVSLGPHEADESGRYWTQVTSGSAQSMTDAQRAARAAMLEHRQGG